ncbi:MAG: Sir2 family NAD-dependent protein deacetylase [Actinomycetota bacterium]
MTTPPASDPIDIGRALVNSSSQRGDPGGIEAAVSTAIDAGGNVVVITGAGVSVPSGLRPYRGKGGRWTEEGMSAMSMATASYFFANQEQGWAWNLVRRTEVMRAEPNDAHHAIVELDRILGDRFVLVTQNVDRLHLRAGSSPERTVEIHGYLEGMRCTGRCHGVIPVPDEFDGWSPDDELTSDHLGLLTCPVCGLPTRPHVLMFDEMYDEENYGVDTARRAVTGASLCITVGTSGGVPVAERLAEIALTAGATHVDINPDNNSLRRFAFRVGGYAITRDAASGLSTIVDVARRS